MSLLNGFGAGLAAMGQSIAETAGQAGLAQQKADLEMQKEQLASQLAEGRETRLQTLRGQQASELSKQKSSQRVGEYQQEKNIDIQNLPAVAKAQDDILKMQASDPKYVQAVRTMTDAKAGPEQRAAANMYMVQAKGAAIANAANQELLDARTALKDAEESGDPDQIKSATQRMYVAQYSMHDEVQRAAALTQQESDARLAMQSLQQQIATHSIAPMTEQPEQKVQREALIRQLQDEYAVAKDNYDTARSMASRAAQNLPSFNLPSGDQGGQNGGMINQAPKVKPPGPTKPPPDGFTVVTP